jgi:hypothetical protein
MPRYLKPSSGMGENEKFVLGACLLSETDFVREMIMFEMMQKWLTWVWAMAMDGESLVLMVRSST